MINQTPQKIVIPATIRVKDLAQILDLPTPRVIKELIQNDIYVTINEEIDQETAAVIAEDLGYEAVFQSKQKTNSEAKAPIPKKKKEKGEKVSGKLGPRPPVVTVMGHVDHGKTTFLDYLRKTDTISQESGGITQHIGAYQVKHNGQVITFIDTPGHEAFKAMRERGAHLTDIAILVIAADDGVQPQTKEAIKHIHKAKIPLIVALNKIDKPEAKPDKVKQELASVNIQIEEWGGKTPLQEISAKTGQGVDELLDLILLIAEMEKLKAPLKQPVFGTVIESHLSSQRGPEATILIQSGTLRIGDLVTAASINGKIKRMEDYQDKMIKRAGPSTPVKIIGFSEIPPVGSLVQTTAKHSKKTNKTRNQKEREVLNQINKKALNPKIKKLNLIIKTDTHGSREAILENLAKLKSKKVAAYIVSEGTGRITESDVIKSHITNSKLIGFRVEPSTVATKLAKQLGVEIHTYQVIYELTDSIKKGLLEMLKPQIKIKEIAKLEVLAIFRTEKDRMIVGGRVTQGIVETNSKIRVKRGGELLGEGVLGELQSAKQKVGKVKAGQEAGIRFIGEIRIEVGDILEFYKVEKEKQTL